MTVFVGAGHQRATSGWRRIWIDKAEAGLWGWYQHGHVVFMAAELEFAAWDFAGRKLWTRLVEPPRTYRIDGDWIRLDIMGR
jgi:hypothetical protein